MKRIFITGALLTLIFNNAKAQDDKSEIDSSYYKNRKLKVEEVNFVTGYYTQNGNNSAVTGGIGSEHLTDVATSIDLKLHKKNKRNNIHSFNFELGVDVYSSASSDKIDPTTISSASMGDVRVYPSASYNYNNVESNYNVGGGLSFSKEFDYTSYGSFLNYSKASKDNNREISLKFNVFFDTWKVILPLELRPPGYGSGSENDKNLVDNKPRNSYNLSSSFSQVINKNIQLSFLMDLGYQEGLLGTSFQRVYFDNGMERIEKLPSTRIKLPAGLRANIFLSDNIVLRTFYRYYTDSWKVNANTISIEPVYKISAFTSFGLLLRIHHQNQAEYFKPISQHSKTDEFYTSDFDLSTFDSNLIVANARFSAPNDGVLGLKKINTVELRYGFYHRVTGLSSHIITLLLKFK